MKPPFFLFPLFVLLVSTGATVSSEIQLAVNRSRVLKLVNAVRAKGCNCGGAWYGPVPAVTWNDRLEKAAQKHSNDMNRRRRMDHRGSDGSDAGLRLKRAGYSWRAYGENIAAGQRSEDQVIVSWLGSAGHCRNIMNPSYREMAVARTGNYWTQVFGKR
jgi:uncharacterized protein YkwD